MSLIHWDKSVLSFHLKEIMEDHKAGDPSAMVGLGAIFVGAIVLPAAQKFGKPILKEIIKSGLSLYPQTLDDPSRPKSVGSPLPATGLPSTVPSKHLSGEVSPPRIAVKVGE